MKGLRIRPAKYIEGSVKVPADKSISHRAAIFASMAYGKSVIKNYLTAADCLSTLEALKRFGIKILRRGDSVTVTGGAFKSPSGDVYCGNSGTTMRLLTGLVSGMGIRAKFTGDTSLSKRPMERIILPLKKMGAGITSRAGKPPLVVKGGNLAAIKYVMPVASAQVKTAVLLAGLSARGTTEVREKIASRDHTERMLPAFGVKVRKKNGQIFVKGPAVLKPAKITVPGDMSSASFFIAAAAVSGGKVTVRNVGINPTRTGFLGALKKMGLRYRLSNKKTVSGEPAADVTVLKSSLHSSVFKKKDIPSMIDELPLLALCATSARGTTRITGAEELKVKECDRLEAVYLQLKTMGASIKKLSGGLEIKGPCRLKGARLKGYGDHRIIMMLAVAALVAEGESVIDDVSGVKISFPGYFGILRSIAKR